MGRIYTLIISMTKLLYADWLRGVQSFNELYSSTINDFTKTNKMAERYLNANEIALEELKAKWLNEDKNNVIFFKLEIDENVEEIAINLHNLSIEVQ